MLNILMLLMLSSPVLAQGSNCSPEIDAKAASVQIADLTNESFKYFTFDQITNVLLEKFVNDYLRRRRFLQIDLPRAQVFVSGQSGSDFLAEQLKQQIKGLVSNIPAGLSPELLKVAYEKKITYNLRLRDHNPTKEIAYNRDFENPLDLAFDGKMQCYSGTMLHLLLSRLYYGEQQFRWYRYVAIFKAGHIIPGYLKVRDDHLRELVGVEQTQNGLGTVNFGDVREIKGKIRLLDAEDFLKSEMVKDFVRNSNQLYSCLLQKTATQLRLKNFNANESLIANAREDTKQESFGSSLNQNPLAFTTYNKPSPPPGDQIRAESDPHSKDLLNDDDDQTGEQGSKMSNSIPYPVLSMRDPFGSGEYKVYNQVFQTPLGIRYKYGDGDTVELLDDLQGIMATELAKIHELTMNKRLTEATNRFDLLLSEFDAKLDYKSLSSETQMAFLKRLSSLTFEFPYILYNATHDRKISIREIHGDFEIWHGVFLTDFERIENQDVPLSNDLTDDIFISRMRSETKDDKLTYQYLTSDRPQIELAKLYEDAIRPELSEDEKFKRLKTVFKLLNVTFEVRSVDKLKPVSELNKILRKNILELGLNENVMKGGIQFTETVRANKSRAENKSRIVFVDSKDVSSLLQAKLLTESKYRKKIQELRDGYLNVNGDITTSLADPYLSELYPNFLAENARSLFIHNSKLLKASLDRIMGEVNIVIEQGIYQDFQSYYDQTFQDYASNLIIESAELQAALKKSAVVGTWIIRQADSAETSALSIEKFSKTIFLPFNAKSDTASDHALVNKVVGKLLK